MLERHKILTTFFVFTVGGGVLSAVLCMALLLPTMTSRPYLDPPFLEDPETVKYVKASKLMVLVSSTQEPILQRISNIYGKSASCISEYDESRRIADVQTACVADQHVVAVSVGDLEASVLPNLTSYTLIALENNYMVTLVGEAENVLPTYAGWHLNEADSCMLGLCAHALLEDLLKTFPEFCSDFRNFTQTETIAEMLKYYQLASSNYNGMLHCTAKYFGDSPPPSAQEYYHRVRGNISMSFETTVIGIVITPRTFGARVKLSPEQLRLWGGDDEKSMGKSPKNEELLTSQKNDEDEGEALSALTVAMAHTSIQNRTEVTDKTTPAPVKKRSPRYFPNCQASLVNSSSDVAVDPDFHPVSGAGRKAHMTLGVAPGESAVTTGFDLLEVVELESQSGEWPTYEGSRGWLRNYGEGRWVLYMKNKITVGSLFSTVYNFP